MSSADERICPDGGGEAANRPKNSRRMGAEERTCPDCGGVLHPIKIVTRDSRESTYFKYTVPEARRSFWGGYYPIEGKITAYMCDSCGRVLLYGHPKEG